MKRISLLLGLVAALTLVACQKQVDPGYETISEKQEQPQAASGTSNAWDGYVLAAQAAVQASPDTADRVNFTPGMKAKLLGQLQPSLGNLRLASQRSLDWKFAPQEPFVPHPSHKGWLALGRALVWQIEQDVEAENWQSAVSTLILATTFGLDLGNGDAADNSIGVTIINQSRQALAPHLGKIPAPQLKRLAEGLTAALDRNRSPLNLIEHEEKNMIQAVQWVMDRHKAREFTEIREKLGREVREAVDYLQTMEQNNTKERPGYFRGFRDEAKAVANHARTQLDQPLSKWKTWAPAEKAVRPWRRLSRHLFTPLEPSLLARQDAVTRIRLVVISSLALAQIQETGTAPAQIPGPESVRIDLYSGQNFIYQATGTEFKVYSVGQDGRDDGGETNDVFSAPDLTIERR